MQSSKIKRTGKGQALVEFALFATLVFFLLTAVIDFGMAYFAYQGVAGAAQEGATYAAWTPKIGSSNNDSEIRSRAHYEAGAPGLSGINRARFVNLLDLDNDQSLWPGDNEDAQIVITSVPTEFNSDAGLVNCPATRRTQVCEMRVTVTYRYEPLFFLAKGLGIDHINISATRQIPITR